MLKVGVIWAQNLQGAIGNDNALLWHLTEDLNHFRNITVNQTVIMGRNTWYSLPETLRPLPNRNNIVISSQNITVPNNVIVVSSIDEALKNAKTDEAWFIGGGKLYKDAVKVADTLEVTFVDAPVSQADTFAPAIPVQYKTVKTSGWLNSSNGLKYNFKTYKKVF